MKDLNETVFYSSGEVVSSVFEKITQLELVGKSVQIPITLLVFVPIGGIAFIKGRIPLHFLINSSKRVIHACQKRLSSLFIQFDLGVGVTFM